MSLPPPTIRDLANLPFGSWTAVEYAGGSPHRWRCRCVCGTERDVDHEALTSGASTSCSCRRKKCAQSSALRRTRWPAIQRSTVEAWLVMLDRGHVRKLRAAMIKAAREPADINTRGEGK